MSFQQQFLLCAFLIDMNIVWICVMSRVCLAGWPSFVAKTLTLDRSFQPTFLILAMLIDTINFYHFIPLSLTLTLLWGHKVSAKQNLLGYFLPHFSTDQDEI